VENNNQLFINPKFTPQLNKNSKDCSFVDLGLIPYQKAYELQQEFLKNRYFKEIPDTVLLLEHPHVFTFGRNGSFDNLLVDKRELDKRSIDFCKTDRGGDITYHGPGQLIVYPIINLSFHNIRIIDYLRKLEECVIRLLLQFGVSATRKKGFTGAWVKDEKIASIGIAAKKWITYHGLCININNALDNFKLINPCGIKSLKVTSLSEIVNKSVEMSIAKERFIESFLEVFEFTNSNRKI